MFLKLLHLIMHSINVQWPSGEIVIKSKGHSSQTKVRMSATGFIASCGHLPLPKLTHWTNTGGEAPNFRNRKMSSVCLFLQIIGSTFTLLCWQLADVYAMVKKTDYQICQQKLQTLFICLNWRRRISDYLRICIVETRCFLNKSLCGDIGKWCG